MAGRFEEEQGSVVVDEKLKIVSSETRGGLEIALAEGRPAAATPTLDECNFKAGGFQHGHGGLADVRLVVADEGVVPK